jgi:hypothetical protein
MDIATPTLVLFLVVGQAVGAVIGALMAVWSEIAYVRAIRDRKVTHAERAHLRAVGRGLRFGMTILLVSSFGLIITAYVSENTLEPLLSPSFATLAALALVILISSWALSKRQAAFLVSSATAFTAWWFLVYLTFGQLPTASYTVTALFFAITVIVFAAVMHGHRRSAAK